MLLRCVLLLLLPLIIGQGVVHCHTLPQQKLLRMKRDTRDLPTDLFKPVGGGTQSLHNEGQNGTAIISEEPTDRVEFLEKVDGEVEAVTESEETDTESDWNRNPSPSWPNYPQNSFVRNNFRSPPRYPIANGNNFPTSPFYQNPNTFSSSGASRSSSAEKFFQEANERRNAFLANIQRTHPSNNPIPYASASTRSSMTPFFSGSSGPSSGPMGPSSGPIGPIGPIGSSSSNVQLSSHFSYSSDGNGPPQIQHSVYDSRMPFGSYNMGYAP